MTEDAQPQAVSPGEARALLLSSRAQSKAAEAAPSGCVRHKGPDLNQVSVISKQFVSAFGPAAPSPLNYSPGKGREFEVKHECFPQSSIAPGFPHSFFLDFPFLLPRKTAFTYRLCPRRIFQQTALPGFLLRL